jgi:hypothetical protein
LFEGKAHLFGETLPLTFRQSHAIKYGTARSNQSSEEAESLDH